MRLIENDTAEGRDIVFRGKTVGSINPVYSWEVDEPLHPILGTYAYWGLELEGYEPTRHQTFVAAREAAEGALTGAPIDIAGQRLAVGDRVSTIEWWDRETPTLGEVEAIGPLLTIRWATGTTETAGFKLRRVSAS